MKPWLYDEEKEKRKLERIKERYFRPVIAYPEGHLTHHGDCSIHRAIEVYGTAACTCGFLHDLKMVSESLKLKIHPQCYEEGCREDGPPQPMSDEDKEKCRKLLEETFGPPIGPSPEEWEETCVQDWRIIEYVFGKQFADRKRIEWLALDDEGY